MEKVHSQLLSCLSAYACGSSRAVLTEGLSADDWKLLYKAAGDHKLEAVVYGTLGRTPGFCGGDREQISLWRQRAYRMTLDQGARTVRLFRLAAALDAQDICYAVIKGAICRSLYKNGDLRVSGDEDLWIPYDNYGACKSVLEEEGFRLVKGTPDDVTHWLDDSGLHIELHTKLCEDETAQEIFTNMTPIRWDTENGSLLTLPDTLHLTFLVYHARKHLITGGVGIRTLCDIAVFYRSRKANVCRQTLDELLEKLSCKNLFYHILSIGRDVLGVECPELSLPPVAEDLLEDVLDAGVYGQSSLARRHSGTLLSTKTAGKKGLLRTLFPSRESMEHRYPELREAPGRLPLLWLKRLGSYGLEALTKKDSSPVESLQLSKKRMEMLVRYEIISKDL